LARGQSASQVPLTHDTADSRTVKELAPNLLSEEAGRSEYPDTEEGEEQLTARRSPPRPAGAQADDLDTLTVEELRGIAQEEEVELHGATRKADLITRIRESRGS
jgi:hypothetical protein